MSDIQDAAMEQAAAEHAAEKLVAKAAIALADAAVAREKCKNLVRKSRESGNTCTRDYEKQIIAYKAAKRRYRVCLGSYIKEAPASCCQGRNAR